MGHRIDKIVATLTVYQEFEGTNTFTFAFVPDDSDKVLCDLLLEKNDEMNLAAAKLAGKADPMDTGIT